MTTRNYIASFCLCLVLWVIPTILSGQSVRATAKADTTRMLIGDHLNLWLEVEKLPEDKVEFPAIQDTVGGKLEVISSTRPDTVTRGKTWKIRQRILLTTFDTGFFVIPPFRFLVNGKDSIKTEAIGVEVLGIPVDTTKGITDIKLPYEIPVTFMEVLPYIVVALLLVTLLFFYFRYLKKRRQTPVVKPEPEIPAVPAHIWALGELDELVREKLWQQGKVKLYYSRLTDILRRYIELRYHQPALEQTTDEIISDFSRSNLIPVNILNELKELLQLADLVKFAKWNPVAEDHELCQKAAYDFVLRTKPIINLRKPVEEGQVESDEKEVGS